MKTLEQKEIKRDSQIKKFCMYGFLKDLRFFEPYLLVFLMAKGISIFEIGILISIREIIVNVFEIPSGFIADYFGRKKELCFAFTCYILSFVAFFFTNSFPLAIVAMIFFGLGEAFRSGTHKAMIYSYLNSKGWEKYKTFVYGRTRSFSLIGSAISSVLGIVLVLNVSAMNYIFLASILPYVLNFILILTYPKFLDSSEKSNNVSIKTAFKNFFLSFKNNKPLRTILVEEGMFSATISYIKDLIQPILEAIILGSGIVLISSLSEEDNLNVILGIVYAILNLLGSLSSRSAYMVKGKKSNMLCLNIIHSLLAVSLLVLGIGNKNIYFVFAVYIVIYCLFNIRKPIFVDEIDEHIEKFERATILSVSSQLKSLFLMIFAPLLGYIADKFGMNIIMYVLVGVFLLTLPLLWKKKKG